MNTNDRELIEQTRKINKTLSLFVFALQEDAAIPTDSQLGIASLLHGLAEAIRARAARQAAIDNGSSDMDGAGQPQALEPSRGTDSGP